MNRMNNGMGCCMPATNGSQMTRRNNLNQSQTACPHDDQRYSEGIHSDLPIGNRRSLLNFIHEEGFASYEAVLYLDTHPDDQEAISYFRLHNHRYQTAVREYGRLYGVLTIDTASASPADTWNWMQQPWPWEGGDC